MMRNQARVDRRQPARHGGATGCNNLAGEDKPANACLLLASTTKFTPPDEMRANAGLVAGSEFLEISLAGHMAPLENPGEFNRGLAAFLDQD